MNDVERIDFAIDQWRGLVPDLDLETMRLGLLLTRLSARTHAVVESAFESTGMSSGEFDVLASLLHAPDQTLTPSDLARLGMLSPSGMTHRLDLLENAGLLAREANPADRRSVRITLTDSGRERALSAAAVHIGKGSEVTATLSASEQRNFRRLVSKVLIHLDELDDAGSAR